jgi:hypothetical protein
VNDSDRSKNMDAWVILDYAPYVIGFLLGYWLIKRSFKKKK